MQLIGTAHISMNLLAECNDSWFPFKSEDNDGSLHIRSHFAIND